jgi:hypothetical protein
MLGAERRQRARRARERERSAAASTSGRMLDAKLLRD